jgi:tetratricopeptide (TPR) repeat protein
MSTLLINPYKVGPPVTGIDFYGRSELLSKVHKALQTSNVVLLQGQRRIGKTSFLKQLSVFLKSPEGTQAFSMPLVPVIFDIQRYIQDTLAQFQWHLAEVIARELQLTAPSLPELESNYALFQDTWLPEVYKRLRNHKLILLVDEFDNLEGQKASQAMQVLIPFLGQLVSGEIQLKWVLTLGRQMMKLPIQYDPIVSAGQQFRMSFLSLEETREVIEKPARGILKYHPTAIDRIYQLTSGQPHLTQALGSEIFQSVVLEQERDTAEVSDVNSIVLQTLDTYSGAISSIVQVPPIEKRVLAAVAQLTETMPLINISNSTNQDEVIKLLLKNNVELSIEELTNALTSLLSWELLKGELKRIKIAVELVRIWANKNLSLELSREESRDIQSILVRSRYEFAQNALQAKHYDLAIKDYREALSIDPYFPKALRGLAEAYRLTGNLEDRATTLKTLYLQDNSIQDELIDALVSFAQEAEKNKKFSVVVEQYENLIKLKNCDRWQKGLVQSLKGQLEKIREDVRLMNDQFMGTISYDWRPRLQEKRFELAKIKQIIDSSLSTLHQVTESVEFKEILFQIADQESTINNCTQKIEINIERLKELAMANEEYEEYLRDLICTD